MSAGPRIRAGTQDDAPGLNDTIRRSSRDLAERFGQTPENASGRWKLADTFNGRFQVDIEAKGQPSKWITLNALRVLKGYYG